MKSTLIVLTIFCSLSFAIISGTHAAVPELIFGYGKTTNPTSPPTSWAVWYYPQFISYEYQMHQVSYYLSAGEYVCFEIGMVNVDRPASLFIDKIELTGPSGQITIFNSGFESGSSGWSAWGSHYAEGQFSISAEAYEGLTAGKLTLFSTGTYSIHGQVPVAITETGTYTLIVYTKVQEQQREIPPDAVFAMEVANQWEYDGSTKEEIVEVDHSSFRRDTFRLRILQNNIEIGNEWYEVWKGYVRNWGFSDASVTYKFDNGLLVAWMPATVGESKRSLAWVLNYNTEVDLTATFLGTEQITLHFDTFEAYRFRYDFTFTGPGGTAGTTFDWWFVPYIGLVKQQEPGGKVEQLVSFRIAGGRVSEVSDYDQDGLKDYQELIKYKTDWQDADTDNDGFKDGGEVAKGTDPNDPDSHPPRAMPWLLLLLED